MELVGGWTTGTLGGSKRGDYHKLAKRIDARDRIAARAQRTEQQYLRKHFLGGADHGPCCLCGRDYPVAFLVASHVKRRAECSPEERGDTRNVVPMCRFGCDELFERGYVYVVAGKIIANERMLPNTTEPVRAYLSHLTLRACSQWQRASEYFRWHADRQLLD